METLATGSATGQTPDSAQRYRADIQGLRGVAVLLVVLYHAGRVIPGGYIGVDVFFVISGFVIANSLLAESERTGSISIRLFVARRVRRLLPALATMLTLSSLLSLLFLSPVGEVQAAGSTARSAAVSLANFQLWGAVDYFAPAGETNPLLHTWSLSVEEQFYLAFPILMSVGVALAGRRAVARAAMFAGLALGSLWLSIRWTGGSGPGTFDDPETLAFYSPFTRAFEFLAGVVLALALASGRRPGRRLSTAMWVGGTVAVAAAAALFDTSTAFPGYAALLPVAGTVALIVGVDDSTAGRGVLSVRPLTGVGDLSYSWYLWHWPLIVFAEAIADWLIVIAVPLSFGVAWLSYRLVELPLRRRTDLVGGKAAAVALVCIGIPLAVGTVVISAADTGLGIAAFDAFVDGTDARERGCHGDLDDPILSVDECTWRVDDSQGLIMLVGDSHAESLADAVIEQGNADGYDVLVQTRSLCPFHDRRIKRRGCANYQRVTASLVERLEPAVVIVGNRATFYTQGTTEGQLYSIVDDDDDVTETAESALDMWEMGLERLLLRISDDTGMLILLDTVPEFPEDGGSASISLLRPDGRPHTLSLADDLRNRLPTKEIHDRLGLEFDNVVIVDPVPLLCTDTCSQRRDGAWIYRDDDHVSAYGAELLSTAFREVWSR